jgi:hypothetical protein
LRDPIAEGSYARDTLILPICRPSRPRRPGHVSRRKCGARPEHARPQRSLISSASSRSVSTVRHPRDPHPHAVARSTVCVVRQRLLLAASACPGGRARGAGGGGGGGGGGGRQGLRLAASAGPAPPPPSAFRLAIARTYGVLLRTRAPCARTRRWSWSIDDVAAARPPCHSDARRRTCERRRRIEIHRPYIMVQGFAPRLLVVVALCYCSLQFGVWKKRQSS